MRRNETKPFKDALGSYIDSLKIKGKLQEVHLISNWEKVVGKTITAATKDIYISSGKLFVKIDSSVIRNELLMIKEPLKDRLNNESGSEVITEIVFR